MATDSISCVSSGDMTNRYQATNEPPKTTRQFVGQFGITLSDTLSRIGQRLETPADCDRIRPMRPSC